MPTPSKKSGRPNRDARNPGGEEPNRSNHDGTPGSGGGGGPPRPSRGLFGLLALLSFGILALLLFQATMESGASINWHEFKTRYNDGTIDKSSVRLTNDSMVTARVLRPETANNADVVYVTFTSKDRDFFNLELNALTGGKHKIDREPSALTSTLIFFLPFAILFLLGFFLISRAFRSAGGGPGGMLGSFGKSRHKLMMKEKTGVKFDDVAGIEEAKSEVGEIIQFLKAPKKFAKLGGRIPRGVLLIGDPGCGKTLLAKAIAGEADVPFFSISGSDFVEMFVGVGASRVRDLFKQAKENSPCIIFLDEIDAVGRRRGTGFQTGGHDEREQTLNAILVEMDGFGTGDGIIVIAATNRADVLDPALTRPGRFDRQIVVPLPDVKGRLEILRVHSKGKKLGPNVNLERLAKLTPMLSGADLAAVMNEAAIGATLQDKDFIEQDDLEEARDKIRWGRAKKSRVREAEENRLTAYHEAGHAVLNVLLKDADPLHKVTIIPRGNFGGASFSMPEKDRHGYGAKYLLAHMRVACGGRIAEQKVSGDVSSGASGDIAAATNMAHMMIEQWGMSPKLGFVRYAGEDTRQSFIPEKAYSDETAAIIDEEVKRLVDEAYADAERLLTEHWEKTVAVAEALIKYETLDANDVHTLMRGEPLGKPSIAEMLAAEAKKSKDDPSPPPLPDGENTLPPGANVSPA